ncbi:MAG: ATP-binding cassette domain-containing protein [Desulfitobacterium sp.]|nr:ATP-binding cassette domain-containing protein [Desulfitobacterium sp.]
MVVKIRNLSFTYSNNRRGLEDINLHIEGGKKTAILGVNGSGKTTLLYHFNGINIPQKGSVVVLNLPVKEKNLSQIRRQVGFLFDYPDHQLFSTTVYRDIKFGLDNYNFPEDEKDQRIRKVARDLDIEDLLDYPPYYLSLGQKKRVAVAGLIVLEPSIIVCDEPFSGLDGRSLHYFKELLDAWVKEGKTIIFSTHDVDLTYEWADNVVILREGRVLKSGTVPEVLTKKDIYQEAGLNKPMLYALFEDSDFKPRTLAEAKEYFRHSFKTKKL